MDVDDIDGLESEAQIYTNQLRELQGRDIPIFYGLFKSFYFDEMGDVQYDVACIILEYFEDKPRSCPKDLAEESPKTRYVTMFPIVPVH